MYPKYKPEGSLIHTPENRSFTSSLAGLERAMINGTVLEETALLCDSEMNLHFDLGGIMGILPKEECVYSRPGEVQKDIAVITRVGKPVCFRVIGIDKESGVPVAHLSRRIVQRDCIREYLSTLTAGDLIRVKITHLEPFGAFADVGCGISALMPVDALSVSRISHPRDRLCCGNFVWAAVKSVDRETGRLFLTQKELLGTWEENAALFTPGQTVAGTVRSIESYGIFVELMPNLAGLAELRPDARDIEIGDTAAVFIKSIIPERMKVKLVIIDSYPAPTPPTPPEYFINPDVIDHLDYWEYSPAHCGKLIETVFE
jgi:small subunit ribosomal protein S1